MLRSFQEALQNDALWAVGNILLRGDDIYAVLFENILVVGGVVPIAGEAVELPDCHIFLWTL